MQVLNVHIKLYKCKSDSSLVLRCRNKILIHTLTCYLIHFFPKKIIPNLSLDIPIHQVALKLRQNKTKKPFNYQDYFNNL